MEKNKVTWEQLTGCAAVSGIGAVLALLLLLATAALMPQSALLQKHTAAAGEGIMMLCALAVGCAEKRRLRPARPLAAAVAAVTMTAVILLAGAVAGSKCSGAAVIVNLFVEFAVSFAGTFFAERRKNMPHSNRHYKR